MLDTWLAPSINYHYRSRNERFCSSSRRIAMLVEERRQRVLDLVSSRGFVALADLAQAIEVSPSTLRRDLDYWHQQGVVRRTHGGAIYVGDATSLPALEERSSSQLEEKRAVAAVAARRIHDGDTVLLDGGTTTL